MDSEALARMLMALQGVTVLEKPRVSRETIISVLRDHTSMLGEFKTELTSMGGIVKSLASDAADNKKIIEKLTDDVRKQQRECNDLKKDITTIQEGMQALDEKLSSLMALKKVVKDHGNQIADLNKTFESHKEEIGYYMTSTTHSITTLDAKASDTLQTLLELKDYVDHFGENLVLAATQITVGTTAGFSRKPMSLLDVLKICNTSMADMGKVVEDHTGLIADNAASIQTKADDTVLFDVDNLQSKVKRIEDHLKREEEQGISAIRKQCDDLTENVQLIESQVADKVDQAMVDSIVHKKYEDIVQYLQDALRSTSEDENNFKAKANELQEIVAKLSSGKADRTDIAPMQEVLVRTEAMLTKFSSQQKDAQKLKDTYSKKEIEALMQLKVDKGEYETQMQALLKTQKKKGKLATLNGGVAGVLDDTAFASIMEKDSQPDRMWKGIADGLKDESDALMMHAGGMSPGTSNRESPVAVGLANGPPSEFAQYIKAKKATMLPRGAVGQMSFPSTANPGMFRSASEAGLPGGDIRADVVSSSVLAGDRVLHGSNSISSLQDAYSLQDYPHVPPDGGRSGHDMSFLGGPTVGGGFNLRAGSLKAQLLKPMGVMYTDNADLEGSGLMVKGSDGRYYYTDRDGDVDNRTLHLPNAKAITTRKANAGISDEIE